MPRFGILSRKIAVQLCLLLTIFSVNVYSARSENQVPSVADRVQKTLAARFPASPELYKADTVALSPTQCGQCHTSVYRDIKTSGGRHSIQCDSCHTRFHAYNPTKQNWQELMPKCGTCHSAPPHGIKFNICSDCHTNPHAIKQIPMSTTLVNSCGTCHGAPFEQLQKFPSAHSKLQCQNCHTLHGYIPGCNVCHKPHFQGQDFKTCAKECHPVHMPREIKYKKDVNSRTCGACHSAIFNKWSASPSKHAGVSCASCHHTKHRNLPVCAECHSLPHSSGLHKHFPNCLTCHQDPHDPPVKQSGK